MLGKWKKMAAIREVELEIETKKIVKVMKQLFLISLESDV